MSSSSSRRRFIQGSLALAAAGSKAAHGQGPVLHVPKSVRPVVIASSNGNFYRNGGPKTAVQDAFDRILAGEDVLEAVVAGVGICELDPEERGVGYGGLPNADGVVQLDASCMHGPKRRAGAVACLEGVRTPARVARAVMELTDHHLLVGADAQAFARKLGFTVEADLNTERSRREWLEWKRRVDPTHYLDPERRQQAAERARREMIAEGRIDVEHVYGTINCNGISPTGEICGVTTTSGLAWKIPGRVGDSPILGAGLYVDGDVGAAGSTGRGEANLYNVSSFLIVEALRRGAAPKDAAIEALRRIKNATVEKRLLDARGLPDFQVNFYVLDRKGGYAGVGLYATRPDGKPVSYAVCTEHGPETRSVESLLGERTRAS